VTAGGLVLATGRERDTGRVTALLLTPTGAP
jgi:hypothetical protein